MTTRFVSDPLGPEALLASALAAVSEAAAVVASGAASAVPHHTGHAADSYQSTAAEITPSGVVATAYTDDPAGHLIEFGSVNNPAYRPLTRGVERAGLTHRLYGKDQR